jgi:hypothetical protein
VKFRCDYEDGSKAKYPAKKLDKILKSEPLFAQFELDSEDSVSIKDMQDGIVIRAIGDT